MVREYLGFVFLNLIEIRRSKKTKSLEKQSEPNRGIGKENDKQGLFKKSIMFKNEGCIHEFG